MLTSVAAILTPDTVMLEFPVFFNETGSVLGLPTGSLPKFNVTGVAVRVRVAATPVPAIGTVSLLSDALLVMVALADTVPTVAGAKARVQFAVVPGAKTRGVRIPVSVKEELLVVAAEMVKVAVPVFFSCTV